MMQPRSPTPRDCTTLAPAPTPPEDSDDTVYRIDHAADRGVDDRYRDAGRQSARHSRGESASHHRPSGFRACLSGAGQYPGSRGGISAGAVDRSEEHTSELQSLMRISYAVFCLKKKKKINTKTYIK